jgi:CO dehydrogenase maturation factor
MGYPDPGSVPPLVELKDLIEERTGAKPGTSGGMYTLNPRVEDIPDKYAIDMNGIKVVVAGTVKTGGSGCYCPENAFVRALVSHLLLGRNTALVLDMEAGVEHLGRGTVGAVDRLFVVVEPGRRSIETAGRIRTMAGDIGLKPVRIIGNKIRSEQDEAFVREALPDMPIAGLVPYDETIRQADMRAATVVGASERIDEAIDGIVETLEQESKG